MKEGGVKAPHDMPVQILLVDDVPQNLVALEKILANRDYTLMKGHIRPGGAPNRLA
ncbi:MAG TPA: hypothetical protein VM925_36150 [Labilithrix sp.]|nr:hypothetical protein [Labilithrix sp.]